MIEPEMKDMAVMSSLLPLLTACLETNGGVLMESLKAQSSAKPAQIIAAWDTTKNHYGDSNLMS